VKSELHKTRTGKRDDTAEDSRERSHEHRDEWLLDEALKERFPASDPISPSSSLDGERRRVREPATQR
jgi:hypothetical protein